MPSKYEFHKLPKYHLMPRDDRRPTPSVIKQSLHFKCQVPYRISNGRQRSLQGPSHGADVSCRVPFLPFPYFTMPAILQGRGVIILTLPIMKLKEAKNRAPLPVPGELVVGLGQESRSAQFWIPCSFPYICCPWNLGM